MIFGEQYDQNHLLFMNQAEKNVTMSDLLFALLRECELIFFFAKFRTKFLSDFDKTSIVVNGM